MEFVFAPEERDVYSYERSPKGLAPLGAKPGSGTSPAQAKAVALLRSEESNRDFDYKHLAPNGAKSINVPLHFDVEFADDK